MTMTRCPLDYHKSDFTTHSVGRKRSQVLKTYRWYNFLLYLRTNLNASKTYIGIAYKKKYVQKKPISFYLNR